MPYTVPVHRDDVFPYGKEIGMGYYDIAENTELLEYLKKNINREKLIYCYMAIHMNIS